MEGDIAAGATESANLTFSRIIKLQEICKAIRARLYQYVLPTICWNDRL